MRVRYVCYPVRTLGPGERLGIWVSGCSRGCSGCMSPELQTPLPSDEVAVGDLLDALRRQRRRYDGATISGGEPFLRRRDAMLVRVQVFRIQHNEPALRQEPPHGASRRLQRVFVAENDRLPVPVLLQKRGNGAQRARFKDDFLHGNDVLPAARARLCKFAQVYLHHTHSSSHELRKLTKKPEM